MDLKKKLLTALLGILVAAAIVAGIRWNLEHFVMVELHFYPRNEAVLDLRGQEISVSRFEKLTKKLPDCEILWDVPLSGGSVASDANNTAVTVLTAEDVALFAYLEDMETVDAEGCGDYENLLALEQAYPELEVSYSVALGRDSFDHEAEEITVSGVTGMELYRLDNMKNLRRVICAGAEASAAVMLRTACEERGISYAIRLGDDVYGQETEELTAEGITSEEQLYLGSLPNLKKVHMVRPQASGEELLTLVGNQPQLELTWEVEVCGVLCSSEDTELDLSGAKEIDLAQVDGAMEYFPKAETVFLGLCALDNETLAAYREEKREQYKLVWTVRLGNKLTARTDDTTFMPVREHVYYFNDEEAYNLRYCEDMVCIDIGHMSIHNIDFVKFMPNLTYLILAHTQLNYIDPISSCKNLKFLELDWSPLRDLSPLVGCTGLEDLNLGNTFASFEPIKQMTWLKNLWVIDCSGGVAYQMSQALPNTKVMGSGSATVDSGWRDLPNYFAMRDVLGMHYMGW
ncbi:MAG: hypothetical protein J6J12_06005 [Oscillospiraceae bacterium]|nr:hypothetical protein [Oscillospiraceae bacterium]